jgi:hypothetical protein
MQKMQFREDSPTFDMVCNYISRLTVSQKKLDILKRALEEVTVEDEEETTQDMFDRVEAQNGQY